MTIGITGGIGSGKSFVVRWLAERYHLPVYDCDSEARRLMLHADVRRPLTALIGADAYLPDGSLNKALLADFVFKDAAHNAAVNAIVHPAVKQHLRRWTHSHQGLLLVESAILVEAGFRDAVDQLIVVEAPLNLRLERVIARDGATEQQVLARMARQMTDDERRSVADYVVMNDGSDFRPSLCEYIERLLNPINE